MKATRLVLIDYAKRQAIVLDTFGRSQKPQTVATYDMTAMDCQVSAAEIELVRVLGEQP